MAAARNTLLAQLRAEHGDKLKLERDIYGRIVATLPEEEPKYDIFGIEVTKEYYNKFKERRFNVFDKKDVSLSVLNQEEMVIFFKLSLHQVRVQLTYDFGFQ